MKQVRRALFGALVGLSAALVSGPLSAQSEPNPPASNPMDFFGMFGPGTGMPGSISPSVASPPMNPMVPPGAGSMANPMAWASNPMMGMMNPMMMAPMMMNPMMAPMMMGPMMAPMMMGSMAPMGGMPGGHPLTPFLTPQNWVNPQSYSAFLNPNAWGAMMNPFAYMTFMNPSMYAPMMNPASYMAFMNPSVYAPMMNPGAYQSMFGAMPGAPGGVTPPMPGMPWMPQ